MGKKRVIKPTKETLLKERERVEEKTGEVSGAGVRRKIERGRIYIQSTYNNTMITLTDSKGDVIFWTSAGKVGFKGTKKGTPFAATKTADFVAGVVNKIEIKSIEVFVKGIGQGREAALRALANRGIDIISIKDITPVPHNGTKPPNPRRV
ncbi:MAG: 30S ribosomal protein S11 [Patescibacteria group bacterium]